MTLTAAPLLTTAAQRAARTDLYAMMFPAPRWTRGKVQLEGTNLVCFEHEPETGRTARAVIDRDGVVVELRCEAVSR